MIRQVPSFLWILTGKWSSWPFKAPEGLQRPEAAAPGEPEVSPLLCRGGENLLVKSGATWCFWISDENVVFPQWLPTLLCITLAFEISPRNQQGCLRLLAYNSIPYEAVEIMKRGVLSHQLTSHSEDEEDCGPTLQLYSVPVFC